MRGESGLSKTVKGIVEIISGGQTGADRAALDVAIRNGIPHSGWCPQGRLSEDGAIGANYELEETPTPIYLQRTEWNVRDSEGTVIFTLSPRLSGGSKKTAEFAERLVRPWVHISRSRKYDPIIRLRRFVEENRITKLNVAGSRESKEPGVYLWVSEVIERAFLV